MLGFQGEENVMFCCIWRETKKSIKVNTENTEERQVPLFTGT